MHADVIFYKKSVDGIIWIFNYKESAEKSQLESRNIWYTFEKGQFQ